LTEEELPLMTHSKVTQCKICMQTPTPKDGSYNVNREHDTSKPQQGENVCLFGRRCECHFARAAHLSPSRLRNKRSLHDRIISEIRSWISSVCPLAPCTWCDVIAYVVFVSGNSCCRLCPHRCIYILMPMQRAPQLISSCGSTHKSESNHNMAMQQGTDNLLEYVFGARLPEMKFTPKMPDDDLRNPLAVRPERHRQLQWIHGLDEAQFRNSCHACTNAFYCMTC
jgi:hypothetical protein